jgi:hypothetical protein
MAKISAKGGFGRAGLAKTPEQSDFTSIQERIEAYARYKKRCKVKQAPKRQPKKLHSFKRQKDKDSEKRIDFELDVYLRLVDWTGWAIREDKKGAIPNDLAPILERIGLNPIAWLKSVSHYNKNYFKNLAMFTTVFTVRDSGQG